MGFFSNNSIPEKVVHSITDITGGNPLRHLENVATKLDGGRKYRAGAKGKTIEETYNNQEYTHRCQVDMRRNLLIMSR